MDNKKISTGSFNCGRVVLRMLKGQGGVILMGLIVTMVIFSVLGSSMVYLFSTSTLDHIAGNFAQRAYYAAEAGMRYAMATYRHLGQGNFSSLNNSTVLLPNNDSFTITVTNITAADATAKVNGGQTLLKGGNINITGADIASFPEKNGYFKIGNDATIFRYKRRTSIAMELISGPSASLLWETMVSNNTTITSPKDQVKITSKGTYPIAGLFSVGRTVEYGWIMSGGAGPPIPPFDPMTDMSKWTSTPPGGSWGLSAVGTIDDGKALRVVETTASSPNRVLIGYQSGVDSYFYQLWNFRNYYLSYDVQVKMKTFHTQNLDLSDDPNKYYLKYFMGGLLFRVDQTGSNYNAFGVGFARNDKAISDGGSDDIPPQLIPTRNEIYLVLYREEVTGGNKTLLAYKKLSASEASTLNAGIDVVTNFTDSMSSLAPNWSGDKTGTGGINPVVDLGPPASIKLEIDNNNNNAKDSSSYIIATPFQNKLNNLGTTTNTRYGYIPLTFTHKASTPFTKVTAAVETSYDGTNWTNVPISAPTNNWTTQTVVLSAPPPSGTTGDLKIRFILSDDDKNSKGSWYIKDVNTSSSNLADWPTILVRIREQTVSAFGGNSNVKVNDIKIYYGTTSDRGTPNATPLDPDGNNDYNRRNNPRGGITDPLDNTKKILPYPPEDDSATPDADYFTLVQWDWSLSSSPNNFGALDTTTVRTTYNTTPSNLAGWEATRPEIALFAFGNEVALNVWFDDFGVNPPAGTGGNTVLPIQQ